MKILIDNQTNLNNKDVGFIIDDLQEREKATTQYYGKWKGYEVELKNGKRFKIETMLMKRYYKVLIMEVNNEISTFD